jgi:hypothetical protein
VRGVWKRLTIAVAATAAICAAAPGIACAQGEGVQASLRTSFTPDRLGASTTVSFGFTVRTNDELAPPPLTGLDLHMPAGMNYIETTLGLATCSTHTLEVKGAAGCPANSRLGFGSAFVEVPFGKGAGHELPAIEAFMGESRTGNMLVLFYVDGRTPVYGQYVFTGEVLPAEGIFGSQLSAIIPLVPSVPGGPDVSIVRAQAAIGPQHLTYYRRRHGKLQAFKPRGIAVPEHCPRKGFPFLAEFSFQDGSHARASSTVPCPMTARPRHRRRG